MAVLCSFLRMAEVLLRLLLFRDSTVLQENHLRVYSTTTATTTLGLAEAPDSDVFGG